MHDFILDLIPSVPTNGGIVQLLLAVRPNIKILENFQRSINILFWLSWFFFLRYAILAVLGHDFDLTLLSPESSRGHNSFSIESDTKNRSMYKHVKHNLVCALSPEVPVGAESDTPPPICITPK